MANVYSEPNWTELTPETYPERNSFDINSTSPMQITGFVVNLLQYHFSSTENIENSALESLLWDATSSASNIFIGRSGRRDTKVSSQLPGIFVERLDCKTVADTLSRQLIDIKRDNSIIDASKDFHMRLDGGHAILCEAESEASSDALAEEVWRRMLYFGPSIQKDFVMSYFNTTGLSKVEQKEDRGKTTYITTVGVSWTKDFKWTLQTEQVL